MLKTVSSITNAIGALNYKGTWNASTNSPALASGVGTKGDYYVVSVAGSTTLDGISNWGVGDWAVYNGAAWQRVEGGADLNGVNLTFTGTASGPTYETSNLTTGATLTNNSLSADGTDTNIDLLANPKGTGGFGINGAPAGVVAGAAFTSKFCVKNEDSSAIGGFVQANNTTAASGSGIFACRSRGTLAAPTVVQSGDNLASLFFLGNDGTDLAIAAVMQVDVDGTPGDNDMPGRIVFKTTPDGSQIPAEAMRIHKTTGVSIGNTTDPGATNLSVTGTITATDLTTTGNTILGNASTDTLNVGNSDLIKDASGNVGIGVSPTVKLDIAGAVQSTGNNKVKGDSSAVIVRNTANAGGGQISVIKAWNGSVDVTNMAIGAIGALKFFVNNSGTESMTLATSGIVTMAAYGAGAATFSAAGVISSVSDETWKTKDGVPLNPDDMLKKLEPGYWYYNEEKAPVFGADRQLGFYAQNVNYAIGVEAAPIPEEGKPWGYYDRSVLAVTVMSLQKALTTIESLTARLEVLEAK